MGVAGAEKRTRRRAAALLLAAWLGIAGSARADTAEDLHAVLTAARGDLVRMYLPDVIDDSVTVTLDQVLAPEYAGPVSGKVAIADPTLYRVHLSVSTTASYPDPSGPRTLAADGSFAFPRTWPGAKQIELRRISDNALVKVVEAPLLVRSFRVPEGADPVDAKYLANRTWAYDQAVATLALMANDDPMVDTFIAGCLALVDDRGNVPFFANRHSALSPNTYYRSGTAAWVLYALADYLHRYPSGPRAGEVKAKLALGLARLETFRVTEVGDRRYGLYTGGIGRYAKGVYDPAHVPTWTALEHQVDIWFLFDRLGEVGFPGDYAAKADDLAAAIVSRFWMKDEQRLRQGVDVASDDNRAPLDAGTWGGLFLARANLQKAHLSNRFAQAFAFASHEARGYTAYLREKGYPEHAKGVWTEGTMGAALLERALGNDAAAAALVRDARNLRVAGWGYRDSIVDPARDKVGSPYAQSCNTAWLMLVLNPAGFWKVDRPPLGAGPARM